MVTGYSIGVWSVAQKTIYMDMKRHQLDRDACDDDDKAPSPAQHASTSMPQKQNASD
jgi:hypothetical protein